MGRSLIAAPKTNKSYASCTESPQFLGGFGGLEREGFAACAAPDWGLCVPGTQQTGSQRKIFLLEDSVMKKLLAILLAAMMLLSFAACGGGGEKDDPNLLKIGDYEALYTGCEIVKDYDGDDTVVINFTFTNKSDEAQSFEWAYYYEVKQGGEDLDYAVVFVSEDSFDTLDDGMIEDVEPGQSKDIKMTYKLKDLTTDVVVEVSDLYDKEKDSVTIDLSTAKK